MTTQPTTPSRSRLLGLAICYLLLVLVTVTDVISTVLEIHAGAVETSTTALWLIGAVGWKRALLLKVGVIALIGLALAWLARRNLHPDLLYLLMAVTGLAAAGYGLIVGNNLAVAWVLLHR